jgi:uncharacterized membrane protein YphA (DoxX/SURF4 family)
MRNKVFFAICRIFVGVLFIFSGLIKANDPTGFGYKLQEYFEVFHITFLNDYAVPIAIVLCTLEIVLGGLLLLGFWAKKVTSGLLLLIIFFTFLTFYSAYFKVVTSCGCFGDAIPLTPWQSFSKDLVLLILIGILFTNRKHLHPVVNTPATQRGILIMLTVVSAGFGIWTYNYLPVVDFLPYKVGNNLPALMRIPPGAPQDLYEITYTLKHKGSGEEKEMTDQEYLKTEIWKDASWEIQGEPEKRLVKQGYQAPIRDLKITDSQGTDYTTEIIDNPYYNLVIVAWNLKAADKKALGDLNAIAINAGENYNIRSVLLTASSAVDAEEFGRSQKLVSEIFYADAVPLKSMVRSNPGLILMRDGKVVSKWHFHSVPSYNELDKEYFSKEHR